MQPLYNVGEDMAFGFVPTGNKVLRVEQIEIDGIFIEEVWDSWNGWTRMVRGPEVDVSYHAVDHLPRQGGVLVPYTRIKDSVNAALPDAEWVDVSGSDHDYWRVLCDYWEPSFDLSICEHDVVWRHDVTEAFDSCPEPWCVFPYDDHTPQDAEAWANMLGCTRYRKELIATLPNAVADVEERFRDWHYCCDGLGRNLRAAGYTHHWHSPPVVHDHGVGTVERLV
jgi:hypothetical protein